MFMDHEKIKALLKAYTACDLLKIFLLVVICEKVLRVKIYILKLIFYFLKNTLFFLFQFLKGLFFLIKRLFKIN